MDLRRWAAAIGLVAISMTWFGLRAASGADAPPLPLVADHATPTPLWAGLLDHAPVPVAAPLSPALASPLDGSYLRHTASPPQWWSCLRCADYRPSGGTWRLRFDHGVMRIVYDVTRWRNIASYEVSGDELRVFNDPICLWEEGVYRWQLQDGRLTLHAVQDTCAFGLRAANLTTGEWLSCAPPDLRAAVSDAWPRPAGCATGSASNRVASASPSVSVTVFPGDVRKADTPPAQIAAANTENVPPPDGIEIDRAEGAVPYGLNLILWEGGGWVELSTELPAQSIGVQFWGPSTMGIARLVFDGQEVWRGEVAQLGSYLSQYGGYLEVSGFDPGRHTLRVEHLGLDTRPLTVMFFGLR